MSKSKKGKDNSQAQAPPTSQGEKLKGLGNESFGNKNFEKAKEYYTQAIELEKSHVFYSNRSAASFELGEWEESLQDADAAIEINNTYVKAYIRKACALREIDRLDVRKYRKHLTEIGGHRGPVKSKGYRGLRVSPNSLGRIPEGEGWDDPERIKIETMINWLRTGQSKLPKLKIRFYEKNYRGVHAARSIKAKDQILFIPKTHLITLEMARETPVGKKMIEACLDLLSPKHSFLSTFLLKERKVADSFWRPYLDLLPSDYNCFPVFFSDDELKWLEGSPFLDQVKEKKSDLKKDYEAIIGVAPEFAEYSFHDFCWARMTASSRIFGIVIGETKTDAFVPLADMLNHKRPKQTSWYYSNEHEGFIIESLEDIQRGEQVYDSYGRKCNSRFFLNYGFINMNNDANEVALKVSYDPNDEQLPLKEKLLGDTPAPKTFRVLANVEEENTVEFMNFIRFTELKDKSSILEVMNAYESSKKNDKNDEGYKPQKTPPINAEIEEKVLITTRDLCTKQLNRYKETIEQDRELLKQNLTVNQRNSVLLRLGEKEILHYLINFVDLILPLLSLPLKQVRKAVLNPKINPFSDYMKRVIIPVMTKKERDSETN